MINRKLMVLTILFVSLLSISAVSATENGTEYCGDEISLASDVPVELKSTEGTFSDLAREIAYADYELNLTRDYTYCDDDSYYQIGISIEKSITINGNGFTINGNNQARVFGISYGDVTLNNIRFVNCYSDGFGGAFYLEDASANLNNVTFINNSAVYGGAIYSKGNLSINDCVFSDATSNYATAVFSEDSTLIINNTQFRNLKASISAGAVGVKLHQGLIIENCNFINTCSVRNGGAILIDSGQNSVKKSFIRNVSFKNTFGDFGGAFIQYGGILDMQDATFFNSTSEYDGGAVYLSNVSATIDNSEFVSNKVILYDNYQTYGGAIYFDYGYLRLTNSKFIDNSAYKNSAVIAIYDSVYQIINSIFDNGGQAVYAVFKGKGSQIVDCTGEDTVSDDNVFYPNVVSGVGRSLTLKDDGINFDTLPSSFDLRDYNLTGTVMDQGNTGSCWAVAATGTLELALLRYAGLNTSLSINNMKNMMIKYSRYGINYLDETGYNLASMAYLISWLGAVPLEYDAYDELGKTSSVWITSKNIHVQDFIIIPNNPETVGGTPDIKQAILNYGPLIAGLNGIASEGNKTNFYNEKTASQYIPEFIMPDHTVIIVGWDDTFSRNNFLITPPGDGAWIVKNSWGTDFGDEGYFYVSYYDKTICPIPKDSTKCAVAIILNNTINYNRNYQYDFAGLNSFDNTTVSNTVTYANKFVSIDDDYIAAVGTYFNQSGVDYTVKVEVNGEIVHIQNGVSPYYGYHTIKLNEYIPIKEGDEFKVYVTSNKFPFSTFGRSVCQEGVSFLYDGGQCYDVYARWGLIACIKVYTVDEIEPSKQDTNLAASYNGANRILTVTLTNGQTGQPIKGANVVVNIDGEKYNVRVNSLGQGNLSLADWDYGIYTAIVSYKGNDNLNPSSTTCNIVIKKDEVSLSAVYDSSAKELVVGLYDDATGSPIKGANVVVNINGGKYNVKINSKGEGRLSVADLDYGTYIITASYKGNSKYASASADLKLIVKDEVNISVVYDSESDELVVSLVDSVTGTPLKGANVVIDINGNKYNVKINSKGEGRLSLADLAKGNYKATISYKGNAKYNAASTSIDIVVKDAASLSAVYDGSADELIVTLVDNFTGSPLKGANVVVMINGEKYNVKITSTGQGKLSLAELPEGTYSATLSYKGNVNYYPIDTTVEFVIDKN